MEVKDIECQLRVAVLNRDLKCAKRLALEAQKILRSPGKENETRLMKIKVWYAECEMECSNYRTAEGLLIGARSKVRKRTRVHLEATALLAIVYLRMGKLSKAKPLITSSIKGTNVISSKERRRDFVHHLMVRYENESMLYNLRGMGEELVEESISQEAIEIIRTETEDGLIRRVGQSIPVSCFNGLPEINEAAGLNLTYEEKKLLPAPPDPSEAKKNAPRVMKIVGAIIWKKICSPESPVYQEWVKKGYNAVVNHNVITTIVVASFASVKIGLACLATAVVAFLVKCGLEGFCEVYQPDLMSSLRRGSL